MASVANLTSGQDNVDAATKSSASVTLTSGRTGIITMLNSKGSTPDQPTLTLPSGVTINDGPYTVLFGTVATPQKRVTMWTTTGGGTGTVDFAFGGATQTGFVWSVDEATPTTDNYEVSDSGTNNADTVTSLTVTLSGTAGDITVSACGTNSNAETITIPTSWTSLSENAHTTPNNRLEVAYILSDDSTADWTSGPTGKHFGAISLRLKETAAVSNVFSVGMLRSA